MPPIVLPLLLVTYPCVYTIIVVRRRWLRMSRGACLSCGYDVLRTITGETTNQPFVERLRADRRRARKRTAIALLVGAVIGGWLAFYGGVLLTWINAAMSLGSGNLLSVIACPGQCFGVNNVGWIAAMNAAAFGMAAAILEFRNHVWNRHRALWSSECVVNLVGKYGAMRLCPECGTPIKGLTTILQTAPRKE